MYQFLVPSLIAAFGWGVNPLFDRFAMKTLDKLNYMSIRLVTMGIIGLLCIVYIIKNNNKNMSDEFIKLKKNIWALNPIYCAIITAVIWCISILFYYTAISNTKNSVVNVTLISYTIPIIVLTILSYIFFNEKVSIKMILGMILTFIGLYITVKSNPNK